DRLHAADLDVVLQQRLELRCLGRGEEGLVQTCDLARIQDRCELRYILGALEHALDARHLASHGDLGSDEEPNAERFLAENTLQLASQVGTDGNLPLLDELE